MNTLDWIFVAVIALLGIRCAIRGFITELLSTAAVILGLVVSLMAYRQAGELFVKWGLAASPAFLPNILGFLAVFIAAFLVIKLVASLAKSGIEAAELGGLDKALGFLLGLAEGLLLVSLALVAMSLLEPNFASVPGYSKLLKGSLFARNLLPIVGPEVAKAAQGIKLPQQIKKP
jgi:membrane protein required for colicin V production